MIELKSREQIEKAIKRAQASRLFVQPTTFQRQYRVTNRANGEIYVVDFFVSSGKRYGHCSCKAGERHLACKHLAAAAGLHVMLAASKHGIVA
jgi:uncharacterized Zn finger protein